MAPSCIAGRIDEHRGDADQWPVILCQPLERRAATDEAMIILSQRVVDHYQHFLGVGLRVGTR